MAEVCPLHAILVYLRVCPSISLRRLHSASFIGEGGVLLHPQETKGHHGFSCCRRQSKSSDEKNLQPLVNLIVNASSFGCQTITLVLFRIPDGSVNQPTFTPLLNGTIVMKDESLIESIAQ